MSYQITYFFSSFSTLNFTGKETDCETGFSYFGARYYDPTLLTSWTTVDPMADKYPSLSPYNYCAWNPVKLTDPDGRELTDFYDISTGEHLKHVEDGVDEAVAINRTVFNACEEDGETTAFEKSMGFNLGRNSEFVALAGTLYAESSPTCNSYDELAGIGSVIRNRAKEEKCSPFEIASSPKSGIYGYRERGKINSKHAYKEKVNLSYKAAMATLCSNTDYSDGAYFWQGKDFSIKGKNAYNSFYSCGFNFTNRNHDIYNMGSYSIQKPPYYKYESTSAAGGTVFMRLTIDWLSSNGATKWDGR